MAGSSTKLPTRPAARWRFGRRPPSASSARVVIAESLTHDIGWNETGPGSGYFPFRVGLLLIGSGDHPLLQIRGTGRAH